MGLRFYKLINIVAHLAEAIKIEVGLMTLQCYSTCAVGTFFLKNAYAIVARRPYIPNDQLTRGENWKLRKRTLD
jgi:hypothetical protein